MAKEIDENSYSRLKSLAARAGLSNEELDQVISEEGIQVKFKPIEGVGVGGALYKGFVGAKEPEGLGGKEKAAFSLGKYGPSVIPTMVAGMVAPPASPFVAAGTTAAQKAIGRGLEEVRSATEPGYQKVETPNSVAWDALVTTGEVAAAGALEKAWGLAQEKILSPLWAGAKGAAKEAAVWGASTGGVRQSQVRLYIENLEKAVKYTGEKYRSFYRKAITPKGSKEPLKRYAESLAERYGVSAVEVTDDLIRSDISKTKKILLENDAVKQQLKQIDLAEKFLRNKFKSGGPELSLQLKNLASVREELSKQLVEVSPQQILDSIQGLNGFRSLEQNAARAEALEKEAAFLTNYIKEMPGGLPKIEKAHKIYSLGSSATAMERLVPIDEFGGYSVPIRGAAVMAGKMAAGNVGAIGVAAAQSPKIWSKLIKGAVRGEPYMSGLGSLASLSARGMLQKLRVDYESQYGPMLVGPKDFSDTGKKTRTVGNQNPFTQFDKSGKYLGPRPDMQIKPKGSVPNPSLLVPDEGPQETFYDPEAVWGGRPEDE